MNNDFNETIIRLLVDYYSLYTKLPKINCEFIFTDDLYMTYSKLRPDLNINLTKKEIEDQNENNGQIVLPKEVGNAISILINSKKVIEYGDTWIGTIAHELTHAIDYHTMAIKENLDSYDPLSRTENYLLFQMWSEFHARHKGYKFLRYETGIDKKHSYEDRLKYVLNEELPYHINSFYNDYTSNRNGIQQIYLTMQLLGRFSVWCELFPDTFNNCFLKSQFKGCIWAYHLLKFLIEHNSLDDIYNFFGDFSDILMENWTIV